MADPATLARGVDHIAVAVADLEAAVERYTSLLGAPPAWRAESTQQQVRVAVFTAGPVKIELMEGTDRASTVARFVAERGEGLHHVCYAVDDLKGAVDRARAAGFEVVGTGEEIGVEGRPVAFLHPRSTGGVLTEFIEGRGD